MFWPIVSKFGGMGASIPGQSDFLDGHIEGRSVILEEVPLRDMDLLKQFILMHPQCQVDVPMDRVKQRQILRRIFPVIGNRHLSSWNRLGY